MTGTLDLPAMDHEMLGAWAAGRVAERCRSRRSGGPVWTCAHPTRQAAWLPGIQHVRTAAITDLYARYQTMRGQDVRAVGGWDCHCPPVEAAVERELGLATKQDVERYGIERFTARCRESARRHIGAIESLGERIGAWWRPDASWHTMEPASIEAIWRTLRQLFDAGLLVRRDQIGPYCPRCQTPLAEREARQGADPGYSVIVRLRLVSVPSGADPRLAGADLLVQTDAPWTLVANTAVAVNPDETYVIARQAGHGDRVVVAQARFLRLLGAGWHAAALIPGADLAGSRYCPPCREAGTDGGRQVVAATFVSARHGTGAAHLAAAFDPQAAATCRARGLPVTNPLEPDGRFDRSLPLVGGLFFADADQVLTDDLRDRGLVFAARQTAHGYPACTRCGTPALRYPRSAWYLCEGTGDVVLSRARYWGTPVPIWECAHGHLTCAGSLSELSDLAGVDLTGLDPHRPYVDAVTILCRRCGATGYRVSDVVDARFDTALAVAESESGPAPLAVGPVADEAGRAMSPARGTMVEPLPVIERYGADAVRWFLATARPPQAPVRLSGTGIDALASRALRRYWNLAGFLVASTTSGPDDEPRAAPAPADRPAADRWLLSELQVVIGAVTAALDELDPAAAGRLLTSFVDDLSHWYVRTCRRRFAAGEPAAIATLHTGIDVLTRLMAPIAPFLCDEVWRLIRAADAADSVHLAAWPSATAALIDTGLSAEMALARRAATLGRSARASAGIAGRQPLARALVLTQRQGPPAGLRELIAEELNVGSLQFAVGTGIGPPAGWPAASRGGMTVAIDPLITAELRRAGLARRATRLIRQARKRDGLTARDPIGLRWRTGNGELAIALAQHAPQIGRDVRAADFGPGTPPRQASGAREHADPGLGLTVWLWPLPAGTPCTERSPRPRPPRSSWSPDPRA